MRLFPRLVHALLVGLLILPAAAAAQSMGPRVISGAGAVDYTHPERLKVGQYARYVIRETINGTLQEYEQTMSVAGFDTLGGEKCVWIETEFNDRGGRPRYCKTLVSLSIAGTDSGTGEYSKSIPEYQRRIMSMHRDDGVVEEMWTPKVVRSDNITRPNPNAQTELVNKSDSLPPTDVVTAAGSFRCVPYRRIRHFKALINSSTGGSRRLHVQDEEVVAYRSPAVLLTSTARQSHRIEAFDGIVPADAPAGFQPPGMPKVTLREILLVKTGSDYVSKFPKNARTVPFGAPPDSAESH
jgi:hypothetical protein